MLPLLLISLSVGRQSVSVSALVTAVSEPSVLAVISVTAITGLQLRRHFRLRPKPEKLVSVGLYYRTTTGLLLELFVWDSGSFRVRHGVIDRLGFS